MSSETRVASDHVLPRYYLVHDTPAGRRFAYPVPVLEGYPQSYDKPTVTWWAADQISVVEKDGWLISDTKLQEITASWLPGWEFGDWQRRNEAPTDTYAQAVWVGVPATPSEEDVRHLSEHEFEGECLRCSVFRRVYERERVQSPVEVRTVDFTGWVPFPGGPDPDPSRVWELDDKSATAVYGAHTEHLWPGRLPGLRQAVYEILKKDPRVRYVFNADKHRVHDQPPRSLQTTVEIKWETPRTAMVDRYGARGRKLRGKQEVPRPLAHSVTTTLVVPDGLWAASKAEALAGWDAAVAEWVEALVPVEVVACDRCEGHGHLLARGSQENREDIP